MNRIFRSGLLLATLVLIASCGPRSRSADPERNETRDGPIGTTLDVRIRDGIEFTFQVTNYESKVELLFPSGQTHDFAVVDSAGRVVWRWSEGRMFTQAIVNKILDTHSSLAWDAAWREVVPPGRYVAVASLLSENKPLEERVSFEVR